MEFRSHLLTFSVAALLAGSLCAQTPNGAPMPQGQPGSPQTSPGRYPDATNPGVATPGTMPDQQQPMDQRASDKKFVKDAAEGAMTEVELGKLAQEKGSSDAVKDFGKRMVEDHSKANEELKQAAVKASIDVPNTAPKKAQKAKDKLSKLSGTEFDRAYAKMMLKDHKSDVKDFDNEAKNGSAPEVKDFAAKTLPKLQEHLKLAEQLNASTRPEVMSPKDKNSGQQ